MPFETVTETHVPSKTYLPRIKRWSTMWVQ